MTTSPAEHEPIDGRKMRALTDMAGAVAHHFNNILGGIVTGIDFAEMSDDPAVTAKVLVQTRQSVWRAVGLVRDLLTFAQGGACPEHLADLTEVLLDVVEDVEKNIKGRSIQFVLDLPTLPILAFPRARIQAILNHLTTNALEAMPGGGTLRISVMLEPARVILEVVDTGHGMDQAEKARVFEPFWSTKRTPESEAAHKIRGMGLAVVFGHIRALGGLISFTSERGQGTTFRVSLPRITDEQDPSK